MNIDVIRIKKDLLEAEIGRLIGNFEKQTGILVSKCSLYIGDVDSGGSLRCGLTVKLTVEI